MFLIRLVRQVHRQLMLRLRLQVIDKFVFTKGTTTDAWDPMVDGINEEDTYIFDTSDVSMKGYALGFSDVKDNGTGGKPLAAADGVTVADAAPGTTGAKTTLVLPAGYGGVNNTNVKELHIYGAEQTGWSCDGNYYRYKWKSIYLQGWNNTLDASGANPMTFVDGNTYTFDVSGMTM